MANYFGLVTRAGHGLIAAALAGGTTVQLTHIALGDGGGAPVSPTESMTALVNEVHRAPINTLEQDAENPALMWAEVVLPAGVGGWYVREAGVLDADGTLVAVASTPESYKPLLAEGSGSELALKLPLVLTNTAAVTLKIDPTVVLASREHVAARVAAHNVAPDTHADLRALAAAAGGVADAHAGRRDNPHAVTAAQAGASPLQHTHTADEVSGLEPGVPVGTPLPWGVATLPEGFLRCTGAEVARTAFAALFAVLGTTYGEGDGSTTFNLPDWRGVKLRGLDRGRGLGGPAGFGEYQADAFQGHWHQSYGNINYGVSNQITAHTTNSGGSAGTVNNSVRTAIADGANGTPRVADETRGKAYGVDWIIKY